MSGVVNLTQANPKRTPRDALRELEGQMLGLGIITDMDVYGDTSLSPEDSYLRRFESEVACCLGLEDAVFMCSGIMAQSCALASHGGIQKDRQNTFLCHYSSHILLHEQNGYSELLGLTPIIIPKNDMMEEQQPIMYQDVAPLLDLSTTTPACVVIECPHREIGGKLTPWDDLVAISEHCRRMKIPLHMDGARLWEAAAGYKKSFAEICALFDSVYVSFYKGLGALTGAMLLGDKQFIADARVWQRRFGGVVYTQLPYAISCWSAFRQHRDSFISRLLGLKEVVSALSTLCMEDAQERTGKNDRELWWLRFDPPVPAVSMIHVYVRCPEETAARISKAVIEETQIACFSRLRPFCAKDGILQCYFEFNMVKCYSVCQETV